MSNYKRKATICIILIALLYMVSIPACFASGYNDTPELASVDTLLFEDFNGPEGPFVNNPLPGWTVIDNGVPEWDETSWSLYDPPSNYEPYWNGNLARVFFDGRQFSGRDIRVLYWEGFEFTPDPLRVQGFFVNLNLIDDAIDSIVSRHCSPGTVNVRRLARDRGHPDPQFRAVGVGDFSIDGSGCD